MGFRVYYGSASGVYSSSFYVAGETASSATLSQLSHGTWYFAVTAIDDGRAQKEQRPSHASPVRAHTQQHRR